MPFSTVLLLDYYTRSARNGPAGVAELFDTSRRVEWGFFAWLIGCLVSMLFSDTVLFTGPLVDITAGAGDVGFAAGALSSGIAYVAFRRLQPLSAGTVLPKSTTSADRLLKNN